jgi:hypothetical protein
MTRNKGRQLLGRTSGRTGIEKTNHRHRRVLRARRERPCCRRASEKRDEFASLHVFPSAPRVTS